MRKMDTRHRQNENLNFQVNKPKNQMINLDRKVQIYCFLSFDFLF